MAKKKEPARVAPAGIAAYAWLDKPDTKFASDGKKAKFKITVKYPKEGAPNQEEIDAFLEKVHAQHHEGRMRAAKGNEKRAKRFKNGPPVKDGDEREDEAMHDFWLVEFNSQYKPQQVDAKRKPLTGKVRIFSGDRVKVAYTFNQFPDPDKEVGANAGVNLRLLGVQLIEKLNFGSDVSNVFEEEDGYEWEDDGSGASDGDDDDGNEGSGDPGF